MEKIKTFCCWSGGKESALSLHRVQKKGIEVDVLLNMITNCGNYSRTHGIKSSCLAKQADATGIELIQVKASWNNYEKAFKETLLKLKTRGITRGIFGDIDLAPHREWVERVCSEIGIEPLLPLWNEKREDLLYDFIKSGFKTIIVTTTAKDLDKKWLGREIDDKFIKEFSQTTNADLCGEKGEYHTFVYNGPIFKESVEFSIGEKIFKDEHWFLEIKLKK